LALKKVPYPVGKIQSLKLNPLSFTEYLEAAGEHQLVELLKENQTELIKALAPRFTRHLSDYYYIGGMPKAVSTFLEQSDYLKARAIQTQIIENLRAKSLRRFSENYDLHAYRFSLSDYQDRDWLTNIPLYSVSTLFTPPTAP
jgi:predicted AAA+ superfamily ATPase